MAMSCSKNPALPKRRLGLVITNQWQLFLNTTRSGPRNWGAGIEPKEQGPRVRTKNYRFIT